MPKVSKVVTNLKKDEKIVINTSNSFPKNEIVNSLEQCVDQNTTSKRILSHDLKKSIGKNFHSVKLPANEEILEDALSTESLYSSLSKNIGTPKRKQVEEEWESSKLCGVCGDKASKFIHYGGRSCQSCRAFFRRTVAKSSL